MHTNFTLSLMFLVSNEGCVMPPYFLPKSQSQCHRLHHSTVLHGVKLYIMSVAARVALYVTSDMAHMIQE